MCPENMDVPMPARVLNVGEDSTAPSICLESTKGQVGSYLALSYCWGCSEQPTTVKSNLAMREKQIDLEQLPKTIQDAVHISRALDVRFLWIDALCIIQDDEDEMREQIKEMGTIYKNALLTIAASSTSSVTEGFLHKRRDPISLCLPIYLSTDSFGFVRLAKRQYESIFSDSLHCRGWTFQEYVLSRRVLLFSKYEMLWRCATHNLVPARKSHLEYYRYFQDLPPQVFGISVHSRLNLQKQQTEIWHGIVAEYSSRTLSKPVDKLNALVGIAVELSTVWKDVYLLGLWSKTLIRDLAWSCVPQKYVPRERLLENVPTWSWLSVSCQTQMYPSLSIEDAQLLNNPESLRAILTNDELTDYQPTIYMRARVLEGISFIEKSRGQMHLIAIDLDDSKILPSDSLLALLGYQKKRLSALCLILRVIKHGISERIGILRTFHFNWEPVQSRELAIV